VKNNIFIENDKASVYERLNIIKISCLPFPWLQSFLLLYNDRYRASRRVRILELLLFKKYERSEYIISFFWFRYN